ncbi:MAG: OmpA family protein [Flavobacteriales bacterium]|nr:OmpA family protein [Flavobacteriales bacterium]
MKSLALFFAFWMILFIQVRAQEDYVIGAPKSIKAEQTPKPKQFKTKDLSWGALDSKCKTTVVKSGKWFKFYPLSRKLRIRVSTGMNWGDLTFPFIYIGRIDTVEGIEILKEVSCQKATDEQGDFVLDVYGIERDKKYLVLIGGSGGEETFALNLTHRFSSPEPEKAKVEEPEKPKKVEIDPSKARIFGRIKGPDKKPLQGFEVELLSDDLVVVDEYTTYAQGVYRFFNIDPHSILLVRMTEDDADLDIKMFLYDHKGQVIGKARKLGHRMYSFHPRDHFFRQITVLTAKDVVVDVTQNESGMGGKVVDRETFLIGKEGVTVGLYSADKSLLTQAVTDSDGRFEFANLEKKEYVVKVDHNPDKDYVEIVLVDDLNVPYSGANSDTRDDDGYFRFEKLPEQEVQLKRMEAVDHGPMKVRDLKHLEDIDQPLTLETIKFKSNSSELSVANNEELNLLAIAMESQASVTIKIMGHTDNVGSEGDNMVLSLDRSETVKKYLVAKGIDAGRIKCEGFGSLRPLMANDTPAGREHNRRVEIEVVH